MLVTGLEAAQASDMPSKPVCHTSLPARSNDTGQVFWTARYCWTDVEETVVISERIRPRVEEPFGWIRAVAGAASSSQGPKAQPRVVLIAGVAHNLLLITRDAQLA
jgi:hypothetical protein